jgi:Uma2 family endonuclease
MTAAQFKDWPGDGTGRRYQLVDGELVAMAPPSQTHGRLLMRLATRVNTHLAEHRPGCEVVAGPGVQPRVDAAHNVRIPDFAVACGPMEDTHYLGAPVLIAEILSPSNMRETREAVRACLTIPSLREALILSSIAVAAEVYLREEAGSGAWPAEARYFGRGDLLRLDSLGFACPMDELYAGLGLA